MEKWKNVLLAYGEVREEVNVQRGKFHGDSWSPLLFNISLIPMLVILNKTGVGYHLSEQAGKINHLLYMDDLQL